MNKYLLLLSCFYSPLPTGEPVDKINEEAYPEYYHGPKEYQDKSELIHPKDRE